MAAETIYQVLKTISNGGLFKKDAALQKRYVSVVAQSAFANLAGRGHSSHSQALACYLTMRAALEQGEGRTPTVSEEDNLAESIRLSIITKHRPPAGYHRRNTIPTPLRRVDVLNQVDLGGATIIAGADVDRPKTLVDEMLHMMMTGLLTPHEAKQTIWDVLAASHQAPRVAPSKMSYSKATTMIAKVRREGGVTALIRRWELGCGEATEMLMVPFGELSRHGQREVIEMLRAVSPDHRNPLFFAALRAATRPLRTNC